MSVIFNSEVFLRNPIFNYNGPSGFALEVYNSQIDVVAANSFSILYI